MTTTAKIAAKGCKNTGLTEDIAKTLHDNLGKTIIAVVELTADARTENRDGDETVKLNIGMIEVAPEGMAADHVRELARSFHYERRLAEDGPTITHELEGPEPKVAEVLAAGARHRPHPFLPDDPSSEQPICDVCGQIEPAAVHSVQDVLPDDEARDLARAVRGSLGAVGDAMAEVGPPEVQEAMTVLDDLAHSEEPEDQEESARHLSAVGDPFNPAG